ncbi:MAG: cytochrome c biogenesis protein ResB [Bdellovibrionales bacterium]|nr:cytochrome c biogenesis protein ResB [Bdellovibrionales bacterium]
MFNKIINFKFLKFLSSLKLAVINILLLGVISAVGTFVESYYDLYLAQHLVYQSVWMKIVLVLFSINLLSVMVDRWPWKRRHMPFVTAHLGIIMIIIGSFLTGEFGMDGSMRLEPEEQSSSIVLNPRILSVYSSFGEGSFSELYKDQPKFILNRPSAQSPYTISLGTEFMEIVDYYPYAREKIIFQRKPKSGWLFHFKLSGTRAQELSQMYKMKRDAFVKQQFGLAHIVISDGSYKSSERNELILIPAKAMYQLVQQGKVRQAGSIYKGKKIQTGWMDLTFELIDFYQAEKVYQFTPLKRPDDNSTSALKVRFQGKESWMKLNSFLSFYSKDASYTLSYMNQRKSIGSTLKLIKFQIDRYQGSQKAKEYSSVVQVDGHKTVTISMNEPLKHNGWTFYQSGFDEVQTASILSVNYDPGRFIKYFGSFLLVAGIFALFYRKRL